MGAPQVFEMPHVFASPTLQYQRYDSTLDKEAIHNGVTVDIRE